MRYKTRTILDFISTCILRFSQFVIAWRMLLLVHSLRVVKSYSICAQKFTCNKRRKGNKKIFYIERSKLFPGGNINFLRTFPTRPRQRESSKRILTRRKIGGKNRTGSVTEKKKTGRRKAVWNGMKIVRKGGMFRELWSRVVISSREVRYWDR